MRRIEYAPSAERDLDDIVDYIEQDNPSAAFRVALRIKTSIEKIAYMPTGRPGRIDGTFERPVRGLPYVIAFELPDEETLRILRVLHAARDWRSGG